MEYRSRQLLDGQFFPEGARWYGGKLWFGDIHAARVVCVEEDGRARTVAQFDCRARASASYPTAPSSSLSMKERVLARVDDGKPSPLADLAPFGPDHINDIVTGGGGRTYVD